MDYLPFPVGSVVAVINPGNDRPSMVSWKVSPDKWKVASTMSVSLFDMPAGSFDETIWGDIARGLATILYVPGQDIPS